MLSGGGGFAFSFSATLTRTDVYAASASPLELLGDIDAKRGLGGGGFPIELLGDIVSDERVDGGLEHAEAGSWMGYSASPREDGVAGRFTGGSVWRLCQAAGSF